MDEIRNDVVIIKNEGGYFGTAPSEVAKYVKPHIYGNQADAIIIDEPNSSEKPNNCEELNAYRECVKSRSFWDNKHCDGCYFDERCPFDEPIDEPQTEFEDKPYLYWDIDGYLDEVGEDEPRTVPLYPMTKGERVDE